MVGTDIRLDPYADRPPKTREIHRRLRICMFLREKGGMGEILEYVCMCECVCACVFICIFLRGRGGLEEI